MASLSLYFFVSLIPFKKETGNIRVCTVFISKYFTIQCVSIIHVEYFQALLVGIKESKYISSY